MRRIILLPIALLVAALLPAMLLLAALLSGCASPATQPATPPPSLFADSVFKPPSAPVGADDLFTLSPSMRAYLNSAAFHALLRTHGEARGLIEALYRKTDLQLDYESGHTRTAAETYAARSGNCLSLVIMTAAFAKELGMRVMFRRVEVEEGWSRDGNLYMNVGHVNVAIGPRAEATRYVGNGAVLVVDFLPPKDAEKLLAHQIEEHQIAALFMNNRAAESLAAGAVDDAYWWARAAVRLDTTSTIAVNTLGVVYLRHGDKAPAERAFRAVLEREPENVVAMNNLIPLLQAMGRSSEAQALAKRAAGIEPVPPFAWFNKGMAAMQAGDFDKARALFAREVKRAPYNDEFHFWLALAQVRLGDTAEAREQLALAIDTSTRRDNRDLYSAKLTHLRSQVMNRPELR
jgi:Tfp pilus assembly protein PilF